MEITSQNQSFEAADGNIAMCHYIFIDDERLCSDYGGRPASVSWLKNNLPKSIQNIASSYPKIQMIVNWLNADRQRRQEFNRIRSVC